MKMVKLIIIVMKKLIVVLMAIANNNLKEIYIIYVTAPLDGKNK